MVCGGNWFVQGQGCLARSSASNSARPAAWRAIPAAQLPNTDSPVWLYDPAKGTSEVFLLEYRPAFVTNSASLCDQNMHSNGLAIWFINPRAERSPKREARTEMGRLSSASRACRT